MDNLLYTGLFRSPVSWAKVNRELSIALLKSYPHFYIHEQRGFLYDKAFSLPDTLLNIMGNPTSPYNDICFIYPPTYTRLKGRKKYAVLTVESTKIQESWKNALNEYMDIIFVPSHFCRDVLEESGVNREIHITPFGTNPYVFYPRGEKKSDIFRFLFIGTPHYRKGILEVIRSFNRVFGSSKDVSLYLKITYKPDGKKRKPWEITEIEELTGGAKNITIDYSKKSDEEIAELIGSSDVIVQPSYSEGFGLSILEAMAMKKTVITTCWSGECEFINKDNALIVDSHFFKSDTIQYGETTAGALMRKPSERDLSRLLEYAYKNFSEIKKIAEKAYETAIRFTWDNTAKAVLSRMT